MSYEEVGRLHDGEIDILFEMLNHAEWVHWDGTKEEPRDYFTWHVTAADVDFLEVFHEPLQQFFLRIPPQGFVHPHVDRRKGITYHVPVTTNPMCACYVEGMPYHLEVGKIYRVDRSKEHWSDNLGSSDRIHLLIETPQYVRTLDS